MNTNWAKSKVSSMFYRVNLVQIRGTYFSTVEIQKKIINFQLLLHSSFLELSIENLGF
jgi:hypothetical protein